MTISVQSYPPFNFATKEERKRLLDNLKTHIAIADDLSGKVLFYPVYCYKNERNELDALVYVDIEKNIDYSKEYFDMTIELDNSYFQSYYHKNEYENNLFCKPTKSILCVR